MLWREPLVLAALVLVPLLAGFLVWTERRRRSALDAFVAAGLQAVVVPDVDPRRRAARHALIVAAVGFLVLALAGPRWGFEWEEVRREGVDLVVALDTSRSMLATDVKPDRLTRAKLAVRDLVAEARGDRMALVPFAGTAFLQCPLTLDHAAFVQSLDSVQAGIIPRGGTNLQAAIAAALEAFDGREGKHQAVVLITDGEKTEGDLDGAIAAAKERGVRVFTVGIGTAEGELIPVEGGGWVKDAKGQVVKSRLDEAALEKVAVDTGGVYLHAQGPALGLLELYRDHIATLDRRALGSTLERRFEHRFQWPLAIALLLLLAEPFIGERRVPVRAVRWLARVPWRRAAAAVVLGALSVGWIDPDAAGREGNRLYAEGKYDAASQQYNAGLVDDPESARLHFNLGASRYKEGKWDDAAAALGAVPPDETNPGRTAATAYNLGNVKFRQAEAAAGAEPQKALQLWAEALVAYRRALGTNPDDQDAKWNHELAERRIEELRKKLEEQAKQQQQDQQDQQEQQQQQGDQDQKDQQQGDQQQDQQQAQQNQQQKDREPQQDQQGEPQQADQQQADQGEPQQDQQGQAGEQDQNQQQAGDEQRRQDADQAAKQQAQQGRAGDAGTPKPGETADATAAAGGEHRDGEMTREEATTLLDAQRDQEVSTSEIVRRMQRARGAAPFEDW